jgi:hypothetical protein
LELRRVNVLSSKESSSSAVAPEYRTKSGQNSLVEILTLIEIQDEGKFDELMLTINQPVKDYSNRIIPRMLCRSIINKAALLDGLTVQDL